MTIVNSWVEYADIFASIFVMLVFALIVFAIVTIPLIALMDNFEKAPIIIGAIAACVFMGIMTCVGIVDRPNTGKTKIECVLDDTISMNYIFDKYDFEDKRGDIYTLVEKEEDKQ